MKTVFSLKMGIILIYILSKIYLFYFIFISQEEAILLPNPPTYEQYLNKLNSQFCQINQEPAVAPGYQELTFFNLFSSSCCWFGRFGRFG